MYRLVFLSAALLTTSVLFGCASTVTPPPVSTHGAPALHIEAGSEATAQPRESGLSPEVMYDVLLGELAGQRGNIDVATRALGRAAQATRDARLAERAALAAIYGKRYDDALQLARLWVELAPKEIEAHEALATALLELDRSSEAQTQFSEILTLERARNNMDQAFMRIAAVLGRQPERAAAIKIMQALVQEHHGNAAAHFALAHLAVRAGELDGAQSATDEALRLRPNWEDAVLFKARILVSRKDVARAQTFYEDYLDRNPNATNVRVNFARYLIDQKLWEKALAQFREVVKRNPKDADAIYAVGLLALQTNRLTEARSFLTKVLTIRPSHDQARLYLGQVAEQEKRWEEAAKWYAEISPGEHYFEAQARLGVVIARRGDLGGARKHLRGVDAESIQQKVQLVLAEEQVLREAKQYREALDVLSDALVRIEADKDLRYARALVAEKLNMLDMVESDLREILKSDPNNVHALNALGYTLADRTTRFEEAKDLLDQALQLKPDDPFILDSVGWLHYRMGNNAEAIKFLKRALSLRNDAEISAHLGEVLWVTGNRNEAESVWRRALKETPDNEALLGVIRKFKP